MNYLYYYYQFVSHGKNQPPPWENLRNQVFLGGEPFVEEMQCKLAISQTLSEIPKVQKRKVLKPLSYYSNRYKERNAAIFTAYLSGGYSMQEVGEHFSVHYSSVSKIVKIADDSQFKT